MSWSSLALDVVVLIIIIGSLFLYRHKGLLAGLIDFVGTLLALLGAGLLGRALSLPLFNLLFRNNLTRQIVALLDNKVVSSISELLESMFGFLPQSSIDSIVSRVGNDISGTTAQAAEHIVDVVVAPIITPFIALVVFLIAFIILRVLLHLLGNLLKHVNRLPLIGVMNKVAGAFFGIFIGVLYAFLLLCIIWVLDALYGGTGFASQIFNHSIVFNLTSSLRDSLAQNLFRLSM